MGCGLWFGRHKYVRDGCHLLCLNCGAEGDGHTWERPHGYRASFLRHCRICDSVESNIGGHPWEASEQYTGWWKEYLAEEAQRRRNIERAKQLMSGVRINTPCEGEKI